MAAGASGQALRTARRAELPWVLLVETLLGHCLGPCLARDMAGAEWAAPWPAAAIPTRARRWLRAPPSGGAAQARRLTRTAARVDSRVPKPALTSNGETAAPWSS